MAPGTYDPQEPTGKGEEFGKVATAPFNSLKERDDTELVDNKPGPGTYQTNYVLNENRVSSANQSNSFHTKVARFAPIAPGSTVYKTASSFYNPGPGSYFK